MRILVRYHALLREKLATDSQKFEIAGTPRVADLLNAFVARHAAFQRLAPSLHVAIGEEIVGSAHLLAEDDTVDLLPPFGGG